MIKRIIANLKNQYC